MTLKPWQEAVLFIVLFGAILALGYGPDRSESMWLIGFALAAFCAYAFLANSSIHWNRVFILAVVLRAVLIPSKVGWTDDHYRYIFDGGITHLHHDDVQVYDITPESAAANDLIIGHEFVPLVNHTDTYTVYPPIPQIIFSLAYSLGSGDELLENGRTDIDSTIRMLRIIILLFEVLTFMAILGFLGLSGLPRSWLGWYALNPLVIMEFAVNLHTEVYMVAFCMLALLALVKERHFLFAVLLGLAAAAKLWPLMFLAFLPALIGWKRSVPCGMLTVITFGTVWIPFYSGSMIDNIRSSLELYFNYFEFNASAYYILKGLLPEGWVKGSSLFGVLTLASISAIGLVAWRKHWKTPSEMFMWAMAIYLALASTVHPWYIIPLLAFAALTRYRWPFIWSALIIPTYLTYGQQPYAQPFWWLWVEYTILFGVVALELMVHSHWGMHKRAAIKSKVILPLMPRAPSVLDIGTGNGSLAHAFRAQGIDIISVDVVNKSRFSNVTPILIDGRILPFEDKSFDVVMLITVLHHTRFQEELIREAKRVGQQVLIMEDVYSSGLLKYLTFLFDSLINLEFFDHPHTNRTHEGWTALFTDLGLEVDGLIQHRTLGVFEQMIYSLSSKKSGENNTRIG